MKQTQSSHFFFIFRSILKFPWQNFSMSFERSIFVIDGLLSVGNHVVRNYCIKLLSLLLLLLLCCSCSGELRIFFSYFEIFTCHSFFLPVVKHSPLRSSLLEVFCKKGVLSKFAKFTGKQLYQSLFLLKLQAWGCFSLVSYTHCFSVRDKFEISKYVHHLRKTISFVIRFLFCLFFLILLFLLSKIMFLLIFYWIDEV